MFVDSGSNWSLAVVTVHLDDGSEEARLAQVKMLSNWLGGEDLPHILCGDFNAMSEWSPEVKRQREKLGLQPPTDQGLLIRFSFASTLC